MKILLVRPVTSPHFRLNFTPPLGLGHLAAAVRKSGHDVTLLDSLLEGLTEETFVERAVSCRPDVIGFQTYSHDVKRVAENCRRLRDRLPNVILVVGGAHPSGVGADVFSHIPHADFAFAGEADSSLPRLLDSLPAPQSPEGIPGLIWREGNAVRSNPPRFEDDLDSFGPPAWDLMPPTSYPESPQGIFFRGLPIACGVVTRGCPGNCTYCAGHTIQGRRLRARSAGSVVDEIRNLQSTYGVREMHFLDDNLTARKDTATALFEGIIRAGIKIFWCCPNGLRLDTLDRELIRLMKRSGCYSISVGIESGDQSVLDAAKKHMRLDSVAEKIRMFREEGLEACGFFILGLPWDTSETIERTIRFACRLPLNRATFSTYMPLPGSHLARQLMHSGEIHGMDFEHLFQADVSYSPRGMTKEQLKALQRKAFLRFFLRPRILWGVLRSLRTPRQLKFLYSRMVIFFG